MDPCSEVMAFFKRAQENTRDVRFANFDVHGMDVQRVQCYSHQKFAELTFDIHEIGFFGFQRTGSNRLKIDPAKVKIVASADAEILSLSGVETFRAHAFPWWKIIWG